MNALTLTPSRVTLAAAAVAARRIPSVAVVAHARRYTTTRQFSDKEKAEEDQYARRQDAEKIKKLQNKMGQVDAELTGDKKRIAELEEKLDYTKRKLAELEEKMKHKKM
ncbi:hypothetical protein BGZ73_006843 [Actinomortierella ambigua]|nr:hypothetical protein BGZ73_006843 [Actinomortierella ambigua]